jgi:hypothetical protein
VTGLLQLRAKNIFFIYLFSRLFRVKQQQRPRPELPKNLLVWLSTVYNKLASIMASKGQFLQARKNKEYLSMSVIRPGVYNIDFDEFRKEWAGSNKGCTGFLVAVENFTNKLFAPDAKSFFPTSLRKYSLLVYH